MQPPRIAPPAIMLVFCLVACLEGVAFASPQAPVVKPASATSSPASPSILQSVASPYRQAVREVIQDATLSARATEEPFLAHPNIFDWLTEHPDRASLAWLRMGVPCVEIRQLPDGRFHWKDDGSELTWRLVGRFEHGMIWYATGSVKPGALIPAIPVKAVAVLATARVVDRLAGTTELAPTVNVFVQTDSRTANAALRILGPAAPRMAEQGAEQLMLFFSGPTRQIYKHPDQSERLLAPGPVNSIQTGR
jgi:hypothetical protein